MRCLLFKGLSALDPPQTSCKELLNFQRDPITLLPQYKRLLGACFAAFRNDAFALAIALFEKIGHDFSMHPDGISFVNVLAACAGLSALMQGRQIHASAVRNGLFENMFVGNALVDMYAKCDVLECNGCACIRALLQGKELHCYAIKCILNFNEGDLVAALQIGKQIHAYVLHNHFEPGILFVANCLIDMYSKSRDVDAARIVFDNMKERNGVSWTSLLAGYGMHGHGKDAVHISQEMRGAGLSPNGRLDDATKLIQEMPMEPSPVVWIALLGGCKIHKNVEMLQVDYLSLTQKMMVRVKKRSRYNWVQRKSSTETSWVETSFALQDVEDKEKGDLLLGHGEKLALAYAILTSAPGATIRITKNLRVYRDCHLAFTYIHIFPR
ncbi:hypothetical protein Ancab_021481 [Ancistrocladus abbreviatus]